METNKNTAPVAPEKDRNAVSLDLMSRMKLHGMARAFRESLDSTMAEAMTPDAFLSMLLAKEWDYRSDAAIQRLIRQAGFRYTAFLEKVDYSINRGLARNPMERLAGVRGQRAEPVHHRSFGNREKVSSDRVGLSGLQGRHPYLLCQRAQTHGLAQGRQDQRHAGK